MTDKTRPRERKKVNKKKKKEKIETKLMMILLMIFLLCWLLQKKVVCGLLMEHNKNYLCCCHMFLTRTFFCKNNKL